MRFEHFFRLGALEGACDQSLAATATMLWLQQVQGLLSIACNDQVLHGVCAFLNQDHCVHPLQNPVPNAYTLAIGGRKPFIVVHTALLELLEPLEVQVGDSCHSTNHATL